MCGFEGAEGVEAGKGLLWMDETAGISDFLLVNLFGIVCDFLSEI